MKYQWILLVMFVAFSGRLSAQGRQELLLRTWDFSRDQVSWQRVSVPHDWAISGPFDKKWDLQTVAIEQNGETRKTEKSGRSGALPWIGEGFYRTTVHLSSVPEHAMLVFDGAMSEPTVIINGKKAGYWAYGYNAFRMNATPFLHAGDNTIAVHLKNREESSRWYPGGGIYRPVKLVLTGKAFIDSWGTYFRTLTVTDTVAKVSVDTQIQNGEDDKGLSVEVALYNPKGSVECVNRSTVPVNGILHADMKVRMPMLWSPESPVLYRLVTRLIKDQQVVDMTTQKVGIRTVSVDKAHGFQLNGISRKLKGVCLHHDLGPLGAAVNKAALIRQVKILKDMGCDAIRTSHNMPSTLQLEVYDSLGMMVMAESFDMWNYPKCKNGYALFFKDWGDKDITNLVLNHRNHASVVMWSIGNEIPEQGSEQGKELSAHLQGLCHQLDPSRPVTQGLDRVDDAVRSGVAEEMDVPGFNYRDHRYDANIAKLPQGFLLGSETGSTVSSRGIYYFPVKVTHEGIHPDGQCSSYDTEYCSWSNLPDVDFYLQDERDWTIGQFVWTGFDYLGEPTPYDTYWPSRSSYFGIVDLAGLPKDRYYLYRSVWNKKEHTIHLLPHWTWKGREGKVTPVYCYTDYPTAELFVNGKSQGKISKKKDLKPSTTADNDAMNRELLDRYRLRWNHVKYEPGEIKVVVYDEKGRKAGEETVQTAGKAVAMRLVADRTILTADGDDIAFVTVSLVDKNGVEVPTATDELQFSVEGAGSFKAVCNGDATSLESFTQPKMKLFSGKLVVLVQASNVPGTIRLNVKDLTQGKIKGSITLTVQ